MFTESVHRLTVYTPFEDTSQAFYRLLKTGAQFYLLSPNISGITDAAQSRVEFQFIHETYQTVVSELRHLERGDNELSTLAALCESLTDPTIVYVRSPKRASDVTRYLMNAGVGSHKPDMLDAVKWVQEHIHPEWHVAQALEAGIGVHHGQIPRSLAQYIVKQFNDQVLDFLICTSTLIDGVNTTARNMVIFDNKVDSLVTRPV